MLPMPMPSQHCLLSLLTPCCCLTTCLACLCLLPKLSLKSISKRHGRTKKKNKLASPVPLLHTHTSHGDRQWHTTLLLLHAHAVEWRNRPFTHSDRTSALSLLSLPCIIYTIFLLFSLCSFIHEQCSMAETCVALRALCYTLLISFPAVLGIQGRSSEKCCSLSHHAGRLLISLGGRVGLWLSHWERGRTGAGQNKLTRLLSLYHYGVVVACHVWPLSTHTTTYYTLLSPSLSLPSSLCAMHCLQIRHDINFRPPGHYLLGSAACRTSSPFYGTTELAKENGALSFALSLRRRWRCARAHFAAR